MDKMKKTAFILVLLLLVSNATAILRYDEGDFRDIEKTIKSNPITARVSQCFNNTNDIRVVDIYGGDRVNCYCNSSNRTTGNCVKTKSPINIDNLYKPNLKGSAILWIN